MRFHGLFIGVDRFKSERVSWLTCARRDAEALHALFVDTLGGDAAVLLTDEDASRVAVMEQFENRLALTGADDIVVITFSGHGSDDHYILTHDADPDDLASTSIHLQQLVDLFAKIPARTVLLVLDCCFSGGAGARVFHGSPTTRAVRSVEDALRAIAHEGRIILAACDPNQEAIEDVKYGHGLLTWFLLEGLRGAPDVVQGGRIPFYTLLQYVSERVNDEAATVGHDQRPAMRGTIDGALTFPIFIAGALTAKRFPDRATPPVSDNVDDLAAYGVPSFIIQAWRGSISALNDLQRRAVNEFGVLVGRSLVVSAPTSSGKTMIGELAAIKGFIDRKRSLFLLPMRALVADKFDDFTKRYSALGLRIIRATGEINDDIPNLLRGRYDICLLTYEKASALLLAYPHILRGVGSIVVDEAQMLADKTRGANLEFLLTLLRYRQREGLRPQIVVLSAVIGDTNGLERWLAAGMLRSTIRPVPLLEGVLRWDGQFRYLDPSSGLERSEQYVQPEPRKGSAQDLLIPLARKLSRMGDSMIVFRETKPETRRVAAYIAENLSLPAANAALEELPQTDPSGATLGLRKSLQHGVAFHNADLTQRERQVIEYAFRDRGDVKVLVATTTLAMGVNTPAATVAIAGLEHPGGEPYSVAEYKNMVGRAGRLGFTEVGKAMVICLNRAEEHRFWTSYVNGKPEPLLSRFLASDSLLLITRVLAAADKAKFPCMNEDQIVGFIQSSFGAFQQGLRHGALPITKASLSRDFARLLASDLIRKETEGYRLTDLGRLAGEGGVAVESIIRLATALRGVPLELLSDAALLAVTQLTQELDDLSFPVHKKSHQERERWQGYLRNGGLPYQIVSAVLDGDLATSRAKRTASVLMWTQGMELLEIEAALLKHLPETDAAGAIRSVADRTRDLLSASASVAEIMVGKNDTQLAKRTESLLVQLEFGVPASMVTLARHTGSQLNRGQYLALDRAGLISIDTISGMSADNLAQLLGQVPPILQQLLATPPLEEAASNG